MTEPIFQEIETKLGRGTAVRIARDSVASVRAELSTSPAASESEPLTDILSAAGRAYRQELQRGTRRVINATGVVIHTNLGRSPLSKAAIDAVALEAGRYCTLEFDLETGKRGRRGERAESMICDLTGAESAVIVNNCAAAAFLVLRVLASGKEVIISRGELVEIGGDFRVPDVLAESGATLREVGTTNRTKLKDYERAIGENTGLILRVHPSNFRVVGFTETPSNSDLSKLARENGLPLVEDAGSGVLSDLAKFGLADEPIIADSIMDGVDLVMFSGDKLMGGVQAGFIVGSRNLVEKIRRHPLYRALRVDKLAYAAIEATLNAYRRGDHFAELPTLRMLSATRDEIGQRSIRLVKAVESNTGDSLKMDVIDGESVIGGGSAPDVHPPTCLISITKANASAEDLAKQLRLGEMPVIARIEDDRVLLDLRTVFPEEEEELVRAISSLCR